MIRFGKLSVEGFGPITNFEWDLDQGNKIVLIKGPTGSGKTTFISAVCWVLYGKILKNTSSVDTWEKLRTKNYRGTKVELYIIKEKTYKIIRCSNYTGNVNGSKGKNRVILMSDGEEVDIKGKTDIQKEINNILGMSWDLFKNSITFGQGVKRLIQESNSDKKKIFEEVFNLQYIEFAREIAKSHLSKHKDEEYNLRIKMGSLKTAVEDNLETYRDLKENEKKFKKGIRKKTKELGLRIEKLEKDLKNRPKSKGDLVTALTKSENSLTQLEIKIRTSRDNYMNSKEKTNKFLSKDELPKWVDYLISIIDKPNKLKTELINAKGLLGSVLKYSSDQVKYSNKKEKLNKKISQIKSEIREIVRIKESIADLNQEISKLKDERNKVLSDKYKKRGLELKQKLNEILPEYERLKKTISNYTWVVEEPLGNKGMKSYLINSTLGFLNKRLGQYSKILGFRIDFGIDLQSVKKDFYTNIEINNCFADYEELSGGQKQMVNIAMAFGMHESTSASKGINVLFLDEIFESLSKDCIETVIELIKFISRDKTIYIVTHHESLPIGGNCKTINVSLNKGISTFV